MLQRHLIPQYVYKAIAQDVARLLKLGPGLPWEHVREHYEPRLTGVEKPLTQLYDRDTARRIADRLDVELKYVECRFNRR